MRQRGVESAHAYIDMKVVTVNAEESSPDKIIKEGQPTQKCDIYQRVVSRQQIHLSLPLQEENNRNGKTGNLSNFTKVVFLFVGSGRWRATEEFRHFFAFMEMQGPATAQLASTLLPWFYSEVPPKQVSRDFSVTLEALAMTSPTRTGSQFGGRKEFFL